MDIVTVHNIVVEIVVLDSAVVVNNVVAGMNSHQPGEIGNNSFLVGHTGNSC